MAKQIPPEFLYNQFLQGECTPEELAALFRYFGTADEETLRALIESELQTSEDAAATVAEQQKLASLKEMIDARIRPAERTYRLWPRIAAAASIVLLLSAGGYFLLHQKVKPVLTAQHNVHDLAPGGNKAILTLGNGQQIVLTNAKNGKLATQGNMVVNKTADGKVVYKAAGDKAAADELAYNTYRTPKGGQFQVTLPDGSEVWLNDASSIRFPVKFAGNERLVTVTGEVYFEVAHDKSKPFRVSSNGQTVEVLGTHFNVNSYADEPVMKTTLLEGSIRISKGAEMAVLKPGDQSLVGAGTKIRVLHEVDTDEEVAWKNGFFQIKDADIQTIMRQAARWYDVEVVYEGPVSQRDLRVKMPRSVPASKFLEALGFFGLKFKIEGKKIIVKS